MINMGKVNKELKDKDIKVCRDCKHLKYHNYGIAHCYHPSNLKLNIINGYSYPVQLIDKMRQDENLCSLKANLFVPIKTKKVIKNESWWQKFKENFNKECEILDKL